MRKFILGTDWWTDCDDAVAIRLLARAHRAGDIALLGIGINACMEHSAASLDGFLNTEGIDGIPIGIDRRATDFEGIEAVRYQKNLIKYATRYRSNADAVDAVRLYRRLLAESDGEVEIAEIGFLQVLAELIESAPDDISPKSGVELLREKVSRIWIMAGKWDEIGGKEHNFCNNHRSRKAGEAVCAECPVPITFLGFEVGFDVITGNELEDDDALRRVLCDHGSSHGRSSWDPMLALLAAIGDEERAGYDFVSGTARVDPSDGSNYFTAAHDGLHRYVIKKKDNTYYQNEINLRIRSVH